MAYAIEVNALTAMASNSSGVEVVVLWLGTGGGTCTLPYETRPLNPVATRSSTTRFYHMTHSSHNTRTHISIDHSRSTTRGAYLIEHQQTVAQEGDVTDGGGRTTSTHRRSRRLERGDRQDARRLLSLHHNVLACR